MTDSVLINARDIYKLKGVESAVSYLAEESSKYPVTNDLFFKYFFKCMDYAFESLDYYETIETNLLEVVKVLEKEKNFSNNYRRVCDYLFKLYVLKRDGNKAMQSANRLTYLLRSNPSDYLLICKEMSDKSIVAGLLFNKSQRKKDIDYVYQLLISKFLELGWNLYIDWCINMELFEVNKIRKNLKSNPIEFQTFTVYNTIKWDINNNEVMSDFFNNDDIDVFKRIIKDYNEVETLTMLYFYLFEIFQVRIDFRDDFLDLDFTDIESFGYWFTDIYIHTKNEYSSFIMGKSNELANEFIEKYTT
jgi:hypothetical protein